MNPSPAQLRLAADIIEKKLEWEVLYAATREWRHPALKEKGPVWYLVSGHEIRGKPWTLPEPPKDRQWHRTDGWTREMLPDGWRPLLDGEIQGREDEWRGSGSSWCRTIESGRKIESYGHYRTKRPLPAEPEWLHLEPCDVPPNAAFRNPKWHSIKWVTPNSVDDEGVSIPQLGLIERRIGWNELFSDYEISTDNGKTWRACKKQKEAQP